MQSLRSVHVAFEAAQQRLQRSTTDIARVIATLNGRGLPEFLWLPSGLTSVPDPFAGNVMQLGNLL